MFMKLPHGIHIPSKNKKDHAIKLHKNLYGLKQADKVWYKQLIKNLELIECVLSSTDEYLYYRGTTIFLLYVDDGIFLTPNNKDVDISINDLKGTGLNL